VGTWRLHQTETQTGRRFEPQFKLQDAVKDLGEWMRRYMA
jgi:hypothetical protein